MKTTLRTTLLLITVFCLFGCADVNITKTGRGYFPPTNPNDVDILMTLPTPAHPFVELGSVSIVGFKPDEQAKMYNGIRAKAAPLGADAVVLQQQGVNPNGKMWALGVAIHFTPQASQSVGTGKKSHSQSDH